MNMYLCSVSAFRQRGEVLDVSDKPILLLKKSKRDAATECMADMNRLYPASGGWMGQKYSVFLVEKSFVATAYKEVVQGE